MPPRTRHPDDLVDSFKAIFEPRYGRPLSDFEAEDGMNNLLGAVGVLREWAQKAQERKARGEPDPVPPPVPKFRPKKNRKRHQGAASEE